MTQNEQMADELIKEIKLLATKKEPVLIAIDGRCASGKTTLASEIQNRIPCNIIHMDHFFLRPEQRTQERYQTPGGNVDYERFLEEVLPQLKLGGDISYQPYDCGHQRLGEPIILKSQHITIIEGSYSCHLKLWDAYDYHCFLTVDIEEQKRRILQRNGEQMADSFVKRWIPLEEKYLESIRWKDRCEMWFDTTLPWIYAINK